MLAALFPAGVATAELRGAASPDLLHPAELEHGRGFAPTRLRDYAAGRLCARHALGELGVAGFPLEPDEGGRPRWPQGMVGSITHTKGFCGAAVARRRQLRGIGLDAEAVDRVTAEIWPQICTPGESAWLRSLPSAAQARAAALIFSGKETFYKCCAPAAGRWVDFPDVEVTLQGPLVGEGSFAIAPIGEIGWHIPAGTALGGRYRFDGGVVVTAMALPLRPGAP
jgi:4'-phosphopantetheinyl transferase EntD